MKSVRDIALCLMLLCLAGCAGIGPKTVDRDRFDYITALSNSWKSQMLLNIVKIRYCDAPVFLDVASVISGYTLETGVNLTGDWSGLTNGSSQSLGASGKYTDRPTITYSPVLGDKFARSMMTPIPPSSLVSLIQAGYPVDAVFRFTIHSINGIRNSYGGWSRSRSADPEFYPLLELMRKVQNSDAIGVRLKKINTENSMVWLFPNKPEESINADRVTLRKLLNIDPQAEELQVVYGSSQASDNEVAILTRSMLDLLVDLSSKIDVPAVHVTEKRVAPTVEDSAAPEAYAAPLLRIKCSSEKPSDAFVSISYHDYWFYIDDRDQNSKRAFSFLMFIFTLVETESKGGAPVVTIPAG
jgi:hypothetical protein